MALRLNRYGIQTRPAKRARPFVTIAVGVFWLFLAAGACKSSPPKSEDAASNPVPSFQRDILPILVQHCASAKDCHGDDPAESVKLDLRAGAAYRALVDAPAEMRAGALRVKPSSPTESFLLAKLTGVLYDREGKSMPLDPNTGAQMTTSPLPPGYVDGVLVQWIAAGAPNN
jgi:hypothetical protein